MAPYIAGSVLVSLAVWLVYYFYVNASHNVKPWRTVKDRLMDFALREGFEVDRQRCTARGELDGVPFAFGMKTESGSKSQHMELWAVLESEEIPPDLELSGECLLSGVSRALGYEEASLGDPEFDAAFWIVTDDVDRARDYLTPSRRRGFLHRTDIGSQRQGQGPEGSGFPWVFDTADHEPSLRTAGGEVSPPSGDSERFRGALGWVAGGSLRCGGAEG